MNQAQALRAARKLLGPKATVQVYSRPSSEEDRKGASAELKEHRALPKEGRDKDWRKRESELIGLANYYRCSIGRIVMGLFNEIAGQGDNLEEALEAAKRKAAA
jgi:hypothetical protein